MKRIVAKARAMFADICGWFTEGFDADLKDAKGLLGELSR